MRKAILSFVAAVLMLGASAQTSADSTGFDGDQLNLPGVLEVFKSSKDLEGFLKRLNSESSEVNNLDLNQDGEVDFIDMRVETDGDNKAVVLSVDVNEKESQDVAIIAMEKTGPETVSLEIIGDANVYGSQIVYTPKDEVVTGAKGGPAVGELVILDWCNVYFWGCVNGMYADQFYAPIWTWSYGVYPSWWVRWRCRPRHLYHARCGYWGGFYNTTMVIHCSNGWAAGVRAAQVSPLVTYRTQETHLRKSKDKKVESNSGKSSRPNTSGNGVPSGDQLGKSKPRSEQRQPTAQGPRSEKPRPAPSKRPASKGGAAKPAPKQSGAPSKGGMKPATGAKKR